MFLQGYLRDKGSEHRQVLEVVEMMLEFMPSDRMRLKDAMKHPFFRAVKKQYPNRYPEYTPTPDRESSSKSRRSSRLMEEIKEKPETDNMETDQSEDAKSSAACAVSCGKEDIVSQLSIDEKDVDDVRMEHILKDEEARSKFENERDPLRKGINLPALEEEKSQSEPKHAEKLKLPRVYDDQDKPKSEEHKGMDVFDTEMNLLNMKLRHIKEEFKMEHPDAKLTPQRKEGDDKKEEDESAPDKKKSKEEKPEFHKLSDAALVEANLTPSQLVRQWLHAPVPGTKSDKSPQGSISPAPPRKDLARVKSSSSPTSSKTDDEPNATNPDDTPGSRRRHRKDRQEAVATNDSFENEENMDLNARLEARRAARQLKTSQDASLTSSVDESEAGSTGENREQRLAARRLRRNKKVDVVEQPPEPKKQEISMRSIFDFFKKSSPENIKIYPDLFNHYDNTDKSSLVENSISDEAAMSAQCQNNCDNANEIDMESNSRMDDAPETVDVTVDLTRKDSNNEEDVYYNAVDELKVTEGNDSKATEDKNCEENDFKLIEDNESKMAEENDNCVTANASFMCVPTQSIVFPGNLPDVESENS